MKYTVVSIGNGVREVEADDADSARKIAERARECDISRTEVCDHSNGQDDCGYKTFKPKECPVRHGQASSENYVCSSSCRPVRLTMDVTLAKHIAESPGYSENILKLAALEEWKDELLKHIRISKTYNNVNDKVEYSVSLTLGEEF